MGMHVGPVVAGKGLFLGNRLIKKKLGKLIWDKLFSSSTSELIKPMLESANGSSVQSSYGPKSDAASAATY